MDWSDYGLWWPAKNMWVNRVKFTLDQYGVQADALLHFTPMHKLIKVQLPDLRCLDMRVDVSVQTFSAVVAICKDLSIQHPEELSLCKPLDPVHLKHNYRDLGKKGGGGPPSAGASPTSRTDVVGKTPPPDTNTFLTSEESNGNVSRSPMTPVRPFTPDSERSWKNADLTLPESLSTEHMHSIHAYDSAHLAESPNNVKVVKPHVRPKTLIEKARTNVAWLDSSLSIMEQGVREHDMLCLRFKFYVFYDLNPKTDSVRINQIYEQAKWQLLNDEIDCTEEEMLMFAALQLQVNTQAHSPQENVDNGSTVNEDDIDAALTDLQTTLEGSNLNAYSSDITNVPQLYDELRFLKPKRFMLRAFKRYWFSYRDLQLLLFKSREDMFANKNATIINMKGCEVTPDVNISQNKYGIKLDVPGPDGMTEMLLRCDNDKQYAPWLAAFRLASKGRSLADSSYAAEVKSIIDFLEMQKPGEKVHHVENLHFDPEEYMAQRYIRKLKSKAEQRILDSYENVRNLSLVEAKMKYIKAWQSLPDYGVSLFVVRFTNAKKDELLGVAYNRLMKMDINTGDNIKTWRYNTLKAWNVNWEIKVMMAQFEEENLMFHCLSADCKVVHEFIGGYIFLSMRSKEANQSLNQELFHKLTGGWS